MATDEIVIKTPIVIFWKDVFADSKKEPMRKPTEKSQSARNMHPKKALSNVSEFSIPAARHATATTFGFLLMVGKSMV